MVFVIALQLSYECLWFTYHFLPVFLLVPLSQHDAKHIKDDAYVLRWNFEFGDKLQVNWLDVVNASSSFLPYFTRIIVTLFHLECYLAANPFDGIRQFLLLCGAFFVLSSGFGVSLSLDKFVLGCSQLAIFGRDHVNLGLQSQGQLAVIANSANISAYTPKGGRRALGDFRVKQLLRGIPFRSQVEVWFKEFESLFVDLIQLVGGEVEQVLEKGACQLLLSMVIVRILNERMLSLSDFSHFRRD